MAIIVRSGTLQLADRVRLLPLAVAIAGAAYLALARTGIAGVVLVVASAALAGTLVLLLRDTDAASRRALVGPVTTGALLAAPALATIYLAFSSGGFYADSVALVTIVMLVLVTVRCALAREPLHGLGTSALIPAAALAALAVWMLASSLWSDSLGRALLEVDRVLLYLVVLLLFATIARSPGRLSFAVRALAVAFVLVAVAAFVSRAAPDLLSTSEGFASNRLSYPLTYWNALGVFCAIGMVLCLHLSATTREPSVVRVLAAGALPVLGATLLLTFSRGGMGAAALGLAVYAVAGHPRGLLTALVAAAPPTVLAVMNAYDATLLASNDPTSPAAIAEGHDLAELVIWCAIAALALRAVLLLADARLSRLELGRAVTRAVSAVALVVAVVTALAFDAPGAVSHRVDQFVEQSNVGRTEQTRERLTSASNQGRLALWEAAVDAYRSDRVKGAGAGTYAVLWDQYGDRSQSVVDAHSVYIETLAELGVIGVVLLVVALGGLLIGVLPVWRGPDRCAYAAILAALVTWLAHAGLDWDWEMPAVTLPLFALVGLALARPADAPARRASRGPVLAAIGLVAIAVAILPGVVLASQQRLDASVEALRDGDCAVALAEARKAVNVLGARPEPHEVVGICLARTGDYGRAADALERALDRDPDNWRLHASLATVLAADGRDPHAEARAALRLNPLEPEAKELSELLGGARPARWRRAARELARSLAPSGRW